MYEKLFILSLIILFAGCARQHEPSDIEEFRSLTSRASSGWMNDSTFVGRGALLLSRFNSFDELRSVITIDYHGEAPGSLNLLSKNPQVVLVHESKDKLVSCSLSPGISQEDFIQARDGTFWDRARIGLISPYAIANRWDLVRIEILGRKRSVMFGEGDIAFYHLAERMVDNISPEDVEHLSERDLSEKGYLNTFNHIVAQALMTSLFSERMADFVSAVHERYTLPELITGDFTEEQLADIEFGPVDNYVDMINNQWGQELGKMLKIKYGINRGTVWTPELLANYLNDLQGYHSWAFGIGFRPFQPTDLEIERFSKKINAVLADVQGLSRHYTL